MASGMRKHVDFEVADWGELEAGPTVWPGYATRMLAMEPEGYWRGVDTAGVAADATGHDYDGAGGSDVTPTEGVVRRDVSTAMACDGTGLGVVVPQHDRLSGFDDFTVMFWLRLATLSQPNAWFGGVFQAGGNDRSWLIRFDSQSQFGMLLSNNGQTNANMGFGDVTFTTDVWHHVAIRRAGSVVTCHLDGVLKQTRSHSGTLHTSGGSLHLGRSVAVDLWSLC